VAKVVALPGLAVGGGGRDFLAVQEDLDCAYVPGEVPGFGVALVTEFGVIFA
jgi:hypothetical protein